MCVEVEGRAELGEAEAAVLVRSKVVQVALLVVVVPGAVWSKNGKGKVAGRYLLGCFGVMLLRLLSLSLGSE